MLRYILLALLALCVVTRAEEHEFDLPEFDEDEVSSEDHTFKAEINRLMGIIINSLYSNRDIFLRELVSNAADAIDKVRFLTLTGEAENEDRPPFEIRIRFDKAQNLLYIRDTGIGMTRQDLINNLGSIAKSGTKDFLEKVQSSGDLTQIGQFGVGFYSSYLVAETVTVITKHDDDDQLIWESTAESDTSYTIVKDPRGNTLGRGTLIVLHMKEDAVEYLDETRLRDLILKYNEFLTYPVYLYTENVIETEVEVEDDDQPEEVDLDADADVEVLDGEEEEPSVKTEIIKETVYEWEQLNTQAPLWRRSKNEIAEEDYVDFYQSVLKGYDEPMYYTHFRGEGRFDFTGLFFIPEEPPVGMWEADYKGFFKLYVKRVFITDNFLEFMPKYLSFVRGLVDSDDLDLNISREMLQQSKSLNTIRKKIVRKIIGMFQEIARTDVEKYNNFYENYSKSLKMGVLEDKTNQDRLSQLLRFYTSKSGEEQISIDDYVKRMKEGQEKIYLLGGDSREGILDSPLIERLVKKGYEVILMLDPLDEYVMASLPKYQGKFDFVNLGKEGVDIDENIEEIEEEFGPLMDYLKDTLKGSITKVIISSRLSTTPMAIVASSFGYSPRMERIIQSQALNDDRLYGQLMGKKVLEINPRHPIVKQLNAQAVAEETTEETEEVVRLLFDSAMIGSGFTLNEPGALTSRIYNLVASSLGVADQEIEEEVFEEPEVVPEPEDIVEDYVEDNQDL